MTQNTPNYRIFLGGMAAGLIGVVVFAGARASADPLVPAPPTPVVPAIPSPVPQNLVTGVPQNGGGAGGSMLAVTPPPAYTATTPGTPAAAPMPPTLAPAVSGTLRDYFQSKGVKLEAQKPQGFTALSITLPMPTGWTQVPDPNVPDAFAVIANRNGDSVYTSNAQVVVYKLVGNFAPREAITHGYLDSQKLLAWQTTNASMADFDGFPSSVIEGTYREGDITLNTSRRHVIATSGWDSYLVSLSVSTDRLQAVADAPAADAIVNGFRVSAPGAPAPAQAPTSAPVGLPGQTPAAAPVGLPGQVPGAAPVGLPGQTPGAAPVGLPGRVPGQLASQKPPLSLADLVPGLPPLPNFGFLQHG